MGCCRLETSKPQNTRVPWQNVAFYLDVVALETSKLIDLWFYVISKTSKPQKMKNCCELLSKLLQSLDLKNLKTIRLMWPQLQTKNLKTAGLLWPELKMGTSKLQNFWISVAPAANQKLITSKQLGYCDRSSKSKPQNFKTLGKILAPAAIPNFKHFKIYSTIWSLWPILKNSKPAARLWP